MLNHTLVAKKMSFKADLTVYPADRRWQAPLSMISLFISFCMVTFLLCRVIYHFYIKNERSSRKGAKMQKRYKTLTLIYLNSMIIYLALTFMVRVYLVFFNGSLYCLLLDSIAIIYFLGRLSLHIIFYTRLKSNFQNTAFRISPTMQKIILTFMIVGPIAALGYAHTVISLNAHDSFTTQKDCFKSTFNYVLAYLAYVIIDFIIVFGLVYLFIRKLSQMLQLAAEMNQV